MTHITIKSPVARYEEQRLGGDVSFFIGEGENAALIGPNGGGKSLLMNYLTGAISIKEGEASVLHEDGSPVARQKISMLTFRDIYRSGAGSQDNYYQKRWQATENEDSPMVSQVLGPRATERHGQLLDALGIRSLLEKRLIFLSSGELRKLTIVRSLMTEPELLIVDNPYIGLDAPSRQTINDVLANVVKTMGLKVILVISHPKDLPNWVDKVVAVKDKKVEFVGSVADYRANADLQRSLFPEAYAAEPHVVPDSMRAMDNDDYTEAVTMRNVHVAYGPVTILDKVDWRVARGDKWALLGKNGSGKSTLLSLVCGDNPQGYANDITLFGRQRGTGESIWDIKQHIGYISPDMHTFYQADIPCLDVVASGFFDTVGLYRKPSADQKDLAHEWMRLFHCDHLAGASFLKVSYGEQRLVMLTRVFVKRPSLVILDEPLHGLDAGKKTLAKDLIESYCEDPNVTLVYVTHYAEEIPSVVDKTKEMVKPAQR